jgi:hypothetical protein
VEARIIGHIIRKVWLGRNLEKQYEIEATTSVTDNIDD